MLQRAIGRVGRPGESHEGVGRKKSQQRRPLVFLDVV